jgi:uncharacterized membrane protein
MNEAHFHLLVNHFPITGTLLGLLVFGFGLLLKNETVIKTSLFLIAFTALLAIPALLSGEGAEELIEELPGISHDVIHEHEEKGELFVWFSGILAVLSLFSVWAISTAKAYKKAILWLTFGFGLATAFLAAQVGNSGGLIRHPEIEAKAANQPIESEEQKEH